MERAFDLEFADALRPFGGTPYRPLARIATGRGGTFLGLDRDEHPNAVKLYLPGAAANVALIRMRNAAELINTLGSPRIVRRLATGVVRDRLWVAAEYVPGPSLHEVVDGHGPLSREGVRHLAQGLIEAFSALHGAGLAGRGSVARDVVLGRTGPVLVDVGLTRIEGAGEPTEAMDESESWSRSLAEDVRAIGALLYLAATGRPASDEADDILSPAVGNCPSALREVIVASQRVRPAARPSLEQLARAANETWVPASLSTQWLAEPWQSAGVLREIDERANDVARLRAQSIDRTGFAVASVPSLPARRDRPIRWEKPEAAARNRRRQAGNTVRGLLNRLGR